MAYNGFKVEKLYKKLLQMGFDEGLCKVISSQMCTDWTADRMLGYISQCPGLKEEDVVDEMLGILADRDRIIAKHEMEYSQARLNDIYNNGLN